MLLQLQILLHLWHSCTRIILTLPMTLIMPAFFSLTALRGQKVSLLALVRPRLFRRSTHGLIYNTSSERNSSSKLRHKHPPIRHHSVSCLRCFLQERIFNTTLSCPGWSSRGLRHIHPSFANFSRRETSCPMFTVKHCFSAIQLNCQSKYSS